MADGQLLGTLHESDPWVGHIGLQTQTPRTCLPGEAKESAELTLMKLLRNKKGNECGAFGVWCASDPGVFRFGDVCRVYGVIFPNLK